jgi:hypothetical protein
MLPENLKTMSGKGFLRDEDYGKLADGAAKVGPWMRTLLGLYHNFGWRKSEAAEHLKVSQIDLESRSIQLSRYSTKNKKPKRLKMSQRSSNCSRCALIKSRHRILPLPITMVHQWATFARRGALCTSG